MGCSESRNATKIKVSAATDKVRQSVINIERDSSLSSSSSGMGSSASSVPQSPEDGSCPQTTEDNNQNTLDTIPSSDLGESLDARRALKVWSKSPDILPSLPASKTNHGAPPTHKGLSCSSAKSEESSDSGIYELDDDYSFVITETSSLELVQRVEREFMPVENLDLTITGKACSRLLSGSQKVRQEEKDILESLRQEGFISTCRQKAVGGLAFEIVESTPLTASAAGSKIQPKNFIPEEHKQRLSDQRNKHSLTNLTPADLHRRQSLAEGRRKLEQDAKLEKITTIAGPAQTIQDKAEELKKKKDQKEKAALEKREAHLRDLRDRLNAQNKKVQQIKLKKLLNAPPRPVPEALKTLRTDPKEEEDDFF